MKVFDKRPLSLILCILLGAFVFFTYGDKTVRITIISVSVILLLIAIFVKTLLASQRVILVVSACLIVFASLSSYLYFDLWFYADNRYSERCEIIGRVESYDFDPLTKTLVISTESINSESFSEYKLKVLLDENDTTDITVGTIIKFTAELCPFEKTSDFDAASYYYSSGHSANAEKIENLTVIEQDSAPFYYKITEYRKSLTRKLVLNSSKESGGLLGALLLGDRDFLSGQLRLDFSRIGISHILALSGMNVAILCFGFSKLLSMLRVGKKWCKVSEILFAALYVTITGFPVSVMRAGIMLMLSSLLFLLCGSKDSVTNLLISVAVIILIQPYSVFDISLWLSAFATLGIIIFAELTEKPLSLGEEKKKFRPVDFFTPILSSVFAVGATLALSNFYFNSISALSIVSTFIFSPIFNIFIYLGTFFLFTATFIPLGNVINLLGGFIADFAHAFSSVKYSLLSTNFVLTEILIIIFTLFLFFFLVLDIRKKKTAALIVCALLASSIASAAVYTVNKNSDFALEYIEQDENERILMKKNSTAHLMEISTPTRALSYKTLSYLKSNDIVFLDDYFITSYTNYTYESLEIIFSGIYIKNVYLPAPKTVEQKEIYSDILKLKEEYQINFIPYTEDEMLVFSDFTLFPAYYDENGKFAATINYHDEFYTYVTADMLTANTENYAIKIMNGANTVIIGAKGSNKSLSDFIYKLEGNTKLIYNRKSGLTDEILNYYENRITVDPSGTVNLYVE